MTTPTPADLPRAGLRHVDAAIHRADNPPPFRSDPGPTIAAAQAAALRFAQANVDLAHAAPEALAQLATEQDVEPVTDPDKLCGSEPVTAGDAEDLVTPEPEHEPATAQSPHPVPQPPFAWTPGTARQPNPLARDQYVRKAGLELAVRFYADDPTERDDADVLATAKVWAEWIRTGQ